MWACLQGHEDIVSYLLDFNDSNINYSNHVSVNIEGIVSSNLSNLI